MKLKLTQFTLHSAVAEVVDLLKPKADQRQIKISTGIPAEEVFINADREKIVKILINL